MTQVVENSETRKNKLVVDWVGPVAPANGDSNILSYNLVWDAGLGVTDISLTGDAGYDTTTSFTITEGLSVGQTYKLKVRAFNIYGWGPFSDEV